MYYRKLVWLFANLAILQRALAYAANYNAGSPGFSNHSRNGGTLLQVGNIPQSEYNALYELYNATNGANWIWTASLGNEWTFEEDANPCADAWQGIICYNTTGPNNVFAVRLSKMNLVGTIPESISALANVTNLQMDGNKLRGGIPHSLYTLVNLETLTLASNGLSGTISNSLGNLKELQYFSLSRNTLSGKIPNNISTLSHLYLVYLGNNMFDGTIPNGLALLPNLQYLDLGNNALTGTVPASYTNAANLIHIDYGYNELHGELPATYNEMINLRRLAFNNNHFQGTVPSSYQALTQLTNFFVGNNQLYGTFPSFITTFLSATSIDISYNNFTGSIPDNLGDLTQLESFYGLYNMLTGTIPNSIGNMAHLYLFSVQYNELTGTIPESLGYKSNLVYFQLNNNQLTGTIPETLNFPSVYIFDVSYNSIHGTIPAAAIGTMTGLVYFYVFSNLLTGSIPQVLFTNCPNLYICDVGVNELTGPIPEITHANTPILHFIDIFSNDLTGTLPESLGTLINLQFFYAFGNLFTGSIPNSYTGMTGIFQLYLDSNLLTGTIPNNLGNMKNLQFLVLDNNMLTGPIPTSMSSLYNLIVVFLYQNKLTGTLDGVFNASSQHELATVVLNNNQLTGTLPRELFRLPNLVSFGVVSNCFHGNFPSNMCNATTLNSLALDGLSSASTCRRTLFPGVSNSYIVTNAISSTIPACLFAMPRLTTLHLSGNGLTGSLPDVRIHPLLIDFAVSHNVLTGTIPARYQRRRWYNLDLSYNRFTGSLLSEFQTGYINGSFYNHLTNVTGINITASSAQSTLSLENNRLSGRLPRAVQNKHNVSVLGSNVFACNLAETNLPKHDSGRANYQCGSNSFNIPFCVWVSSVLIMVAIVLVVWRYHTHVESVFGFDYALFNIVKWQNALQVHQGTLDPARRLEAFQTVLDLSKAVCVIAARCTLYMIVILLPLYTVSSQYSGTLLHQYAWMVSAAYLSGGTVTALLFVSLVGLSILALRGYAAFYHEHRRYIAALASVTVHKKFKLPSLRTVLVYGGFICLNLVVVVGANVAYVYVAIYGKNNMLLVAELLLSCFKLFWNRFFSVYLIRWTAKLKAMTEQRGTNNSMDSVDTTASGRTTKDRDGFVTLQLFVSLLNNIAVPCLAVAGISPSCFYHLFVGAPVVDTKFTYRSCILVTGDVCTESEVGIIPMSYKPPFTYNYQCSSSFITYYAPTFVFMCVMRAFLSPLLQWALYSMHRYATPGTRWHQLLDAVLVMSLHPVTSAADIRIDVYRPYFDANQLLLSLFTYTGLLLTFGAVFPPVAVALLFTLVSVLYFNQLKVSRLLSIAAEKGLLEYADVIEAESRRAGFLSVLQRVVWMLITVSCWFYTLFLFDTLGDAVGFEGAYWVLIVFPLMPLVLYIIHRVVLIVRERQQRDRDMSMESIVETTHNILRNRGGFKREIELTQIQEKVGSV